jgi:ribosomal protein S19E (S16A)
MPSSWITEKINVIKNLVDIGVIEKQQNCLIVTASGRPVLNSVFSDLLSG